MPELSSGGYLRCSPSFKKLLNMALAYSDKCSRYGLESKNTDMIESLKSSERDLRVPQKQFSYNQSHNKSLL